VKANLKSILPICIFALTLSVGSEAHAEEGQSRILFGANASAGHYLQVDDAKIYYETYGSGDTPLVLLHGGLYGYIEEFGDVIQQMSKYRRLIAIATRGHGRSELGTKPFSYTLFANDAFAVIRHETRGKVDVLGFSDGAVTSYPLTTAHPELVRRLGPSAGHGSLQIGPPMRKRNSKMRSQAMWKGTRRNLLPTGKSSCQSRRGGRN
jgi:pimeloyl-ACP methyl ester carboxylesterase